MKPFHIVSASKKINAPLHHMSKPKYGHFCLYRSGNLQYISWYIQMQPITTFWRNFQTAWQKSPSALTSMIKWVQTFNNIRNFRIRTDWERLPAPRQMVQTGNFYFCQHQKVSEENSCRFKGDLLHQKEYPDKAGHLVSIHDELSPSVSTTGLCSTGCHLSIVYPQLVVWFWFF